MQKKFEKHYWLVVLLIACAASAVLIEYLIPAPKSGPILEANESIKLAVESFTSLRELLVSWSFGVVAGIAFFLKANVESKLNLERHVFLVLIFSAAFVVASFFSGHLVLDRLALLLSMELNPFKDRAIYVLGLMQYLLLLFAIVAIIYAMALIYIPRLSAKPGYDLDKH